MIRWRLAALFWGDLALLLKVWPGPWTPERQAVFGRVTARLERALGRIEWTN